MDEIQRGGRCGLERTPFFFLVLVETHPRQNARAPPRLFRTPFFREQGLVVQHALCARYLTVRRFRFRFRFRFRLVLFSIIRLERRAAQQINKSRGFRGMVIQNGQKSRDGHPSQNDHPTDDHSGIFRKRMTILGKKASRMTDSGLFGAGGD